MSRISPSLGFQSFWPTIPLSSWASGSWPILTFKRLVFVRRGYTYPFLTCTQVRSRAIADWRITGCHRHGECSARVPEAKDTVELWAFFIVLGIVLNVDQSGFIGVTLKKRNTGPLKPGSQLVPISKEQLVHLAGRERGSQRAIVRSHIVGHTCCTIKVARRPDKDRPLPPHFYCPIGLGYLLSSNLKYMH